MMKRLFVAALMCMATFLGAVAQTVSMKTVDHAVMRGQKDAKVLTRETAGVARHAESNVPSWKESFEEWDEQDMFWLPDGWTAKRTASFMDRENPHTWAVQKQLNIYYPAPMDGKYYATCYYNDDAEQDEWLYSPAVTPGEGEFLTYFVTLRPFYLFDMQYFDRTTETFSQLVSTADLKLYISVDGGEWQQMQSLFDLYKEENLSELYEQAHYGYMSHRKMFLDMAPYVGRQVRFAFRYHGKGGETLWLDDIRVTKPSLTAGYQLPSSKLFLGMTPDFEQLSGFIFLPDETPLTWMNTSSFEAQTFDWQYTDTHDYARVSRSSDAVLTTTYTGYVPRAEQVSGKENIISLPTLNVGGVGGLSDSFTHPYGKMLVGGKAELVGEDGEVLQTGASFCHPSQGTDLMIASTGAPYFGVGDGNKALWTNLFGVEAEVTGVGMLVTEPQKAWQLRGLHIQGIGNIIRPYRLSVSVHKFNVYGSVEEEPLATAVIDEADIVSQPDPMTGLTRYTLPFVFEDVFTLDRDVIFMLDGLPQAATWFAPLQTAQYEEVIDDSHAIFQYNYIDGGQAYMGMNYVSNLGVYDDNGLPQACATNFFFNFDMAYGDCDDWGHVDIDVSGPGMPDINAQDNTIVLVNAETLESLYGDQMPYKPLLCGFYDEKDADLLTLYLCIGQLYEYEEGPFYSDKVNDTYYIRLTLPKAMVDGSEHGIGSDDIAVDYYDLLSHQWVFNATSGTVKVSRTADHVYEVDIKALDSHSFTAMAARYCYLDAWRMHDYNERRPDPSQFEFTSAGRVKAHYDILSCVVDQTNPDLPVFYFADQEGLTTTDEVKALDADHYITIQCPTALMDGLMKGFSGWANDDLTISYMGLDYNHSNCRNDETCYGGNVAVLLYDTTTNRLTINAKIFTMTQYNMYNMALHYEGSFSPEGSETSIEQTVPAVDESLCNANLHRGTFNLSGQRVSPTYKGIVISGGKKILKQR